MKIESNYLSPLFIRKKEEDQDTSNVVANVQNTSIVDTNTQDTSESETEALSAAIINKNTNTASIDKVSMTSQDMNQHQPPQLHNGNSQDILFYAVTLQVLAEDGKTLSEVVIPISKDDWNNTQKQKEKIAEFGFDVSTSDIIKLTPVTSYAAMSINKNITQEDVRRLIQP